MHSEANKGFEKRYFRKTEVSLFHVCIVKSRCLCNAFALKYMYDITHKVMDLIKEL